MREYHVAFLKIRLIDIFLPFVFFQSAHPSRGVTATGADFLLLLHVFMGYNPHEYDFIYILLQTSPPLKINFLRINVLAQWLFSSTANATCPHFTWSVTAIKKTHKYTLGNPFSFFNFLCCIAEI